jgi:hypothetical protein
MVKSGLKHIKKNGLKILKTNNMKQETLEEPKCTCKEHDPYCCQVHGSCPTCVKKKEEPKQTDENGKPITYWGGLEEPEQEIVGYRLKPFIDRIMVDGILKNAMPIWNDEDKSVYFIRGHVAGSLVAKMKELQVLDLWFIPIYEDEEIKSDWVKEHHLEYYYKEGIMKEEPKQETIEEAAEKFYSEQSESYENAIEPTFDNSRYLVTGFIAGAKFQAEKMFNEKQMDDAYDKGFKDASERMYSEEEVRQMLWELGDALFNNNQNGIEEGDPEKYFDGIIEQFKKQRDGDN